MTPPNIATRLSALAEKTKKHLLGFSIPQWAGCAALLATIGLANLLLKYRPSERVAFLSFGAILGAFVLLVACVYLNGGGLRKIAAFFLSLSTARRIELFLLFIFATASGWLTYIIGPRLVQNFYSQFGLIIVAAVFWRLRWGRPLAILLMTAWGSSMALEACCLWLYDSHFTAEMAEIFMSRDTQETLSALSYHGVYVIFGLLLCGIAICSAWRLSALMPIKALKIGLIGFLLYSVSLPVSALFYMTPNFLVSDTLLYEIPLSNLRFFLFATKNKQLFSDVAKQKIDYKFQLRDVGIETYVLVVGESARRDKHGIYGYTRDTTPNQKRELERMLLFSKAIAPAPHTNAAIPRSLCRPFLGRMTSGAYADNILNLANRTGFATHWFSAQIKLDDGEGEIRAVAGFSSNMRWRTTQLDDALIPLLEDALKTQGKKLIVLHLNGSHTPHATRYPSTMEKFADGDPTEDAFDNSIYYTDFVLGKIFNLLRDQKASVLYYSDHALLRKKHMGTNYFIHGHDKVPKEAVDVPLWLWYSPAVEGTKKTGKITQPYSTSDNYHLLSDWMGISLSGCDPKLSPLHEEWNPRKKNIVYNALLEPLDYASLKSEKEP
jgi:glucan phosphoethanolaminetransferase (alkaline phosphatase superfamily)